MSSSFDLSTVNSFAAGTEGPAGQRVFYLQAVTDSQVVTLRLEKQQVSLLADYLERIVDNFDLVASAPVEMPDLYQPVIAEWVVGSIMVAIDENESKIIVIAAELTDEDDDADEDELPSGAQARFGLTRSQVEAFVRGAKSLVTSGRPTCPLCGRPVNPDGHFCPRLN